MVEDERLTQIETEKQEALTGNESLYGGMVADANQYYQSQIDASKEWTSTQQNLQQAQTDFTIQQIEQQKEQEAKDYTKEQSGAYVDWQKESNKYGANAEQMAAGGLANTGYSESSKAGMYNAYQNRVATARESYRVAVLNYNNAIKEAQLQNSSALAEIAYQGLQQQLALSLEGFRYKNELLQAQANQAAVIENTYHNRYMDVLNQINTEKAQAEQIRQYEQDYAEGVRQFNAEMERLKELDNLEAEREKAKLEEEKRQFDLKYAESSKGADSAILKEDETTGAAEAIGAAVARKALSDQAVSGYYPGKTTTNQEITDFIEKNMPAKVTGSYSASGYRKKLAKDEKKLHGSDTKANSGMTNAGRTHSGGSARIYEVSTDYYQGDLNPDAKTYGTFKNGYQPKGIEGHGKLEKTDDTYTFNTTKQYGSKAGKTVQVKQNVWEAEDGTRWYWEGKDNEYKPFKGV